MEIRSLLRALGSLKLAAVVLILLCVAMACATVHEATYGTPAAMQVFYKSRWFEALLWLLGLNVLASALARWPWQRRHIGFLATHASLLLILGGALITQFWGVDGQVSIAEGSRATVFTARDQETLALRKPGAADIASVDLGGGIGGIRPIDRPRVAPIETGGAHLEVNQYLPATTETTQVRNDNDQPAPALQVQLTSTETNSTAWVFPDEQPTAELPVTLRIAADTASYASFLQPPASQPAGNKSIKVEAAGTAVELPLEQCLAGPVDIGSTGYRIRVLRYLPHAMVGEGRQLVSASERPVNPAIEYELLGPGSTTSVDKSYAFARFPDMSMHPQQGAADVKVTLDVPSDESTTTGIELLASPDGRLAARFTPERGGPTVQELSVGTAVATPWEGLQFTVLQRYDHARREQVCEPANSMGDERIPALRVTLRAAGKSRQLWLRKLEPQQISLDGQDYELAYQDKQVPLGFELRLDKFHVGRYPGSGQPRSFESHITLVGTGGTEQSRVISMNHPVTFGRYSLFQSSYQQSRNGPAVSVLSVSRDPGLPIVFTGYVTLIVSMLYVLVQRTRRRKSDTPNANEPAPAATGGRPSQPVQLGTSHTLACLLSIAGLALAAAPTRAESAAKLPQTLNLDIVRAIPVQHDGRWMPLDTVARDEIESTTDSETYNGHDPMLLLLAWTFDPVTWSEQPLVGIHSAELRRELKLPDDRRTFSYKELVRHKPLRSLMEDLRRRPAGKKMDPLESKVSDIQRKLFELQDVFSNEVIRPVPDAEDRLGSWLPIELPADAGTSESLTPAQTAWLDLRDAFLKDDAGRFTDASNRLTAELAKLPAAYRPDPQLISTELSYNRVDPYARAWQLMFAGAFLAAIAVMVNRRWMDVLAVLVILLGFAQLTHGMWMRGQIAGHLPAANMFESLLFMSWGAGAFAIVSLLVMRDRFVPLTASFIGALSLCLADVLPIDHFIRPIAPVLLDTVWMSIHVPGIMVSYAVLALAMLIAHAQLVAMAVVPRRRKLIDKLDSLHYWYMHVGTILLGAGIITGSMWAAASWGRYWGWDPKEVWSLIAFLAYLVILHVRTDRELTPNWIYGLGAVLGIALLVVLVPKLAPFDASSTPAANYLKLLGLAGAVAVGILFIAVRGQFATAVKSMVAFWSIIMTYVGVNYVLGIGLHSYGFGTGAVVRYMLLTGGGELLVVAILTVVYLVRQHDRDAHHGSALSRPAQ